MLTKLFAARPDALRPSGVQPPRGLAMAGSASAALACELLRAPGALMQLTPDEAHTVVSYMLPMRIPAGNTFIHQGEQNATDFMLLVLDGEVLVETVVVSRTEPVTVTVLGPGSLIGEMGLLDGAARSASCTASTALACAFLTPGRAHRADPGRPAGRGKLMLAVAARLAQRLRDTSDKLNRYATLIQAMQQEIDQQQPS